jgi:hypothetical protein
MFLKQMAGMLTTTMKECEEGEYHFVSGGRVLENRMVLGSAA